jgi:hypothetical protein
MKKLYTTLANEENITWQRLVIAFLCGSAAAIALFVFM